MAIANFVPAVKNNMLAQIQIAIDAGSSGGKIKIYTGTMPTLPTDAVTTQTLLGTLTFSETCGATADGVLTMNAIAQDSSADASGVATWARITDSDDATVVDVNVSVIGGNGSIQLNTTNIVALGPISIASFTVSM